MKGLFQCPPWARSFCPFRAYWVISTVQVDFFFVIGGMKDRENPAFGGIISELPSPFSGLYPQRMDCSGRASPFPL